MDVNEYCRSDIAINIQSLRSLIMLVQNYQTPASLFLDSQGQIRTQAHICQMMQPKHKILPAALTALAVLLAHYEKVGSQVATAATGLFQLVFSKVTLSLLLPFIVYLWTNKEMYIQTFESSRTIIERLMMLENRTIHNSSYSIRGEEGFMEICGDKEKSKAQAREVLGSATHHKMAALFFFRPNGEARTTVKEICRAMAFYSPIEGTCKDLGRWNPFCKTSPLRLLDDIVTV